MGPDASFCFLLGPNSPILEPYHPSGSKLINFMAEPHTNTYTYTRGIPGPLRVVLIMLRARLSTLPPARGAIAEHAPHFSLALARSASGFTAARATVVVTHEVSFR